MMLNNDKLWHVQGIEHIIDGFAEIMILEETKKYSKIGKSTFYRMEMESKISGVKVEFKASKDIKGCYALLSDVASQVYSKIFRSQKFKNNKNLYPSKYKEPLSEIGCDRSLEIIRYKHERDGRI